MEDFIVRSWKALALRGLAGIVFGMIALVWPAITLLSLVLLFGAYAMVDGILALAAAVRVGRRMHAWTLALEGLLGVAAGLSALLWTGITTLLLVTVIGLWAMLTGVIEIVLAVHLRRVIPGEILLGLSGCVSLLLGVLMLLRPGAGAFAIIVILGGYAFCFGALMLALALRLRSRLNEPFPMNEGSVDRGFRTMLGLALLLLVFVGPKTLWGLVGLVPLVTGLVGTCPLYTVFGLSTCRMNTHASG